MADNERAASTKRVGWVEPFAKPIIFASTLDTRLMGIASLYPSYELKLPLSKRPALNYTFTFRGAQQTWSYPLSAARGRG